MPHHILGMAAPSVYPGRNRVSLMPPKHRAQLFAHNCQRQDLQPHRIPRDRRRRLNYGSAHHRQGTMTIIGLVSPRCSHDSACLRACRPEVRHRPSWCGQKILHALGERKICAMKRRVWRVGRGPSLGCNPLHNAWLYNGRRRGEHPAFVLQLVVASSIAPTLTLLPPPSRRVAMRAYAMNCFLPQRAGRPLSQTRLSTSTISAIPP